VASFLMLLALSSVRFAAAGPTKWTILVYMLADNNLEQYGLFDLEVGMQDILHLLHTILTGQSAACQALIVLSNKSWSPMHMLVQASRDRPFCSNRLH
jgi:hypothetical protein